MIQESASSVNRFFVLFQSIVYEALPFIVIGALISGTLEELLPQKWFAKVLPRRRWLAIAGSALLGLVFPMCECGIVVVMRRLLKKGLPLGCAVAYMLAAPIINPVVMSSTWAAFSGKNRIDGITSMQMLSLRVGLAFIIAVIVGLLVEALARRKGIENLVQPFGGTRLQPTSDESEEAEKAKKPRSWRQRLMNISEVTLRDFVDITCYLIIGALLAATIQTFRLVQYAPGLTENVVSAILFMMFVSIILCLCSEADAFVAANLPIEPSLALAAKLAFLVLGPMMDLKLYVMYTRVFKPRLIWTIITSVVILVFIGCLAVHYLNLAFTEIKPL